MDVYGAIDTKQALHHTTYRTYIVRDYEDGRAIIDFGQETVQLRLEMLIHIRVGFIEDEEGRSRYYGSCKENSLELPPRRVRR